MAEVERFKDRAHAGKLLAQRLKTYAHRADVVVLALPRGGVPIGYAVASALDAELDIFLVRKLGMPGQEEFALGAIGSGGVRVLQPGVPGLMGITQEQVEAIARRESAEIVRRERLYRGARAPVQVRGRTVLLVDDGIATGSTMLAAVEMARKQGAARIVVAVPVAPPDTLAELAPRVDDLVCLSAPLMFRAVSQWYREFGQTSDEEVQDLLAMAWRKHPGHPTVSQPTERTQHEIPDDRNRT
jgi:putative phosphoribosyl transferase